MRQQSAVGIDSDVAERVEAEFESGGGSGVELIAKNHTAARLPPFR